MRLNLRARIWVAWRFFSTLLTFGVVGAGIGFLQGEIAARGSLRPEQMALAEGASVSGSAFALVLGPVLYFVFLGKDLAAEEFFGIVGGALVAGVVTAFVVPVWEISMCATALTTIFVTAIYKELRKRKTLAGRS